MFFFCIYVHKSSVSRLHCLKMWNVGMRNGNMVFILFKFRLVLLKHLKFPKRFTTSPIFRITREKNNQGFVSKTHLR